MELELGTNDSHASTPTSKAKGRRSAEDASKTREKIIEAALALFVEAGFNKTSNKDIGSKVGIAHSNIYNHFKSKSEIYAAICVQAEVQQELLVNQALTKSSNPLEFFSTMIDLGYEQFKQNPTLHRFQAKIASELSHNPELIQPIARVLNNAFQDRIVEALKTWQQSGDLAQDIDPEDLAQAYTSAMMGLAITADMTGEKKYLESMQVFKRMLLGSLFSA